MVEVHADRDNVLRAAVELLDVLDRVDVQLDALTHRTQSDEHTIDALFGSWDTLLDLAEGQRFLQQQASYLHAFHHDVRRCRTRAEFVHLVEQHLRAAYTPQRVPLRQSRLDILARCRTHPELAAAVVDATRRGSRILGDVFSLAQTRGWVDPGLDTEMLATWTMGHVYGRLLIELDDSYTPEQGEAWNRMSIDAVLTALGCASAGEPPRRRRWVRRARA